MKMTPHDYAKLQNAIAPLFKEASLKDSDTRTRWAYFWEACKRDPTLNGLYDAYNDDHIDTALLRIFHFESKVSYR